MSQEETQEETYPEVFEDVTLALLHQAFVKAARIMFEIGPQGKNYWDMLHAANSLLDAMCKVEDAAYEWRSYAERLDEDSDDR